MPKEGRDLAVYWGGELAEAEADEGGELAAGEGAW